MPHGTLLKTERRIDSGFILLLMSTSPSRMILKRGGLRGRDSKDRSFLIPFHLTLPAAAKRLFAVGSRVRKSKRRKGAQGLIVRP